MDTHPKYLPKYDVVADTLADEQALDDGRAVVAVVKRDGGDLHSVRYLTEKELAAKAAAAKEKAAREKAAADAAAKEQAAAEAASRAAAKVTPEKGR